MIKELDGLPTLLRWRALAFCQGFFGPLKKSDEINLIQIIGKILEKLKSQKILKNQTIQQNLKVLTKTLKNRKILINVKKKLKKKMFFF